MTWKTYAYILYRTLTDVNRNISEILIFISKILRVNPKNVAILIKGDGMLFKE